MAEESDEDSPGVFDGVLLEGDDDDLEGDDDDDLIDMDDDDFEEIGGLDAEFSDIDDDCEEPPVQAPKTGHAAQPCGFLLPGNQPAAVNWPFVVPTVATSGSTASVVRNRIGAQQNEEEDVSEIY